MVAISIESAAQFGVPPEFELPEDERDLGS
jgi:hypothetical protein